MKNNQKWYVSHAETIAQNVIGLLVSYLLLTFVFGLASSQSLQIQAVFFVTSYIRSYVIRRIFNGI